MQIERKKIIIQANLTNKYNKFINIAYFFGSFEGGYSKNVRGTRKNGFFSTPLSEYEVYDQDI